MGEAIAQTTGDAEGEEGGRRGRGRREGRFASLDPHGLPSDATERITVLRKGDVGAVWFGQECESEQINLALLESKEILDRVIFETAAKVFYRSALLELKCSSFRNIDPWDPTALSSARSEQHSVIILQFRPPLATCLLTHPTDVHTLLA